MVNAEFSIDGGVATIELTRPEALNAMDMPTKLEITERMTRYRDDDRVRVVVLAGRGDAFCAGGDLEEVIEEDFALQPFTDTWEDLFRAMTGLGKPIVARVDGYALGGGFDLLLHADLPIAADEALLGQPEVGLGVVNHFSPPLLQRTIGLTRTLDMMLTGDTITGEEAARLGLVARSVPAEDIDDEVDAVVDSLLEKSPRILRKLKAGIYATAEMSPRAGQSYLEAIALESAREDPDYREGVRAQREGRNPEWSALEEDRRD